VQVASARAAESVLARTGGPQVSTFVEVADRLRPSVVSIHGSSDHDMSSGTGLIVSADGTVLTNYHVIEGMSRIVVTLSSADRFEARVVGQDEPTDLALLRIDGATDLLPAVFGDSETLRVAEEVLVIGAPFGLGWTVTRGIISSLHRSDLFGEGPDGRGRRAFGRLTYTDYIQTDAAINLGNSGGPIVNSHGEVIGISVSILSRPSEGIGFAIPSNDARFVANELMQRGKVRRGYLGVVGRDLSELDNVERRRVAANATGGMIVTSVAAGTAAEKAGLQAADVILAIDGKPVESFEGLRNRIARTPPLSEIALRVVRGGLEREVRAVIGEFPE
jgi:S1-C subfamily serine protease